MNDSPDFPRPQPEPPDDPLRCPNCDAVVTGGARQCLLCGQLLPEWPAEEVADQPAAAEPPAEEPPVAAEWKYFEPLASEPPAAEPVIEELEVEEPQVEEPAVEAVADGPAAGPESVEAEAVPEAAVAPAPVEAIAAGDDRPVAVVESVLVERQSRLTLWLTAVFAVTIVVLGLLVLRYPASATISFLPTMTPLPPTLTHTPTLTPIPSETSPPTATPTITPIPPPTDTPQPPRFHTVASGETLFGLSLFFGVSAESIAEANGLVNSGINVNQELLIPWPTATPPLVAVEVTIGDQTVIADPTGCERYEILGGDTLFGIAARTGVDLRAILAVNRLTDQSILQPGDTICIPEIIRGGVLPPTPGPSPTPTDTPPPAGPQLLYPGRETIVEPPQGPLILQWVAVKDLAEDEWYMVEVTDLTDVDAFPRRGYTRQNSFRVPEDWRPQEDETHYFRWRVSIVVVTGEREDGSFIYTFGGRRSEDRYFFWLGAVPTPTPTPSPTATPTAQP